MDELLAFGLVSDPNGTLGDLLDDQTFKDLKNEITRLDEAIGVDNQYRYVKTEEFKDLIKQPKNKHGERYMQFDPTDDWWLKYKPYEFKRRYPTRYKAAKAVLSSPFS